MRPDPLRWVAAVCGAWLALELSLARMRATSTERFVLKLVALIVGGVVIYLVYVVSNHP